MALRALAAKLANTKTQHGERKESQKSCAAPHNLPGAVVPYLEEDPTISEWIRSLKPSRKNSFNYLQSLIPFTSWLPRYNVHWLLGDAIAGLTVGFVVVPQAMAYALLADLSPEFGLYTSFMGAALYWFFGTSKDVVIGTTAVGSLLVGEVISKVKAEKPGAYTAEEIAKAISLLSGFILIPSGLFRLGWLIELIPYIPISAFVTSASFTIIGTQLPVTLGISGIHTREAPYKVYINVLKGLGRTQLDAAIGLTSIVLLYALKYTFTILETRQPKRKELWATLSSLRLTFTILLYTLVSWLVHRGLPHGEHKFRLVGTIDSGFKHAGVPKISNELLSLVAPSLPSMIIILIVEHVAVAKSFGKQFGYKVNASQEVLAQGASNALGTFVGGYACTGSFGASAVLSKAGARTPLASLFSAGVLILALYALTAMFYYIPMAALAGLIIHAVVNLMTPPNVLHKYWRLSPFELLIWVVGIVVALFVSLETSIYTTVALSFALLLVRMAKSEGSFLGRTLVCRLAPPYGATGSTENEVESGMEKGLELQTTRTIYLPSNSETRASRIPIAEPYPGIFVYRFNEPCNYINKAQHMERLTSHVIARTKQAESYESTPLKDRLWSEPILKPNPASTEDRPILRAIILDCSSINNLDIASVQGLDDARKELERYAAPAPVEWYFAALYNRWTRRALAEASFGCHVSKELEANQNWCPTYSVALSSVGVVEQVEKAGGDSSHTVDDFESQSAELNLPPARGSHMQPIYGIDRPFFHVDVFSAVDAAIRSAKKKDGLVR